MTLLTHINEIHDPSFVARCQDDLIVEYNKYLEKINVLLANDNYELDYYSPN